MCEINMADTVRTSDNDQRQASAACSVPSSIKPSPAKGVQTKVIVVVGSRSAPAPARDRAQLSQFKPHVSRGAVALQGSASHVKPGAELRSAVLGADFMMNVYKLSICPRRYSCVRGSNRDVRAMFDQRYRTPARTPHAP